MFVGLKTLDINDVINKINFACHIFYPTQKIPKDLNLGPYTISVANNAEVLKSNLPLILLSHGSGGTYLAYRDLIFSLVQDGYVVVCPLHFGNHRDDNHLSGDKKNLILRPVHLKLTLDNVLKTPDFKTDQIGFIGHSMGGYAGITLAGGEPWLSHEEKLPTGNDKRIKVYILLSPAAGYFQAPNSLDKITAPLQIWVGENDEFTPLWQAQLVRDLALNSKCIDFHLVKNGNHFCFLSSYPKSLSHLQPAKDLPGFDRVEYQRIFFPEVKRFLNTFLK